MLLSDCILVDRYTIAHKLEMVQVFFHPLREGSTTYPLRGRAIHPMHPSPQPLPRSPARPTGPLQNRSANNREQRLS
jgi:hypothetical protein